MLFRLASNYSRLDVRTSPSAHSAANARTPLCASEAEAARQTADSFNYCPTRFSGKRSGLCGMSCASEQGSQHFIVERIAGMIDPGCRRHPRDIHPLRLPCCQPWSGASNSYYAQSFSWEVLACRTAIVKDCRVAPTRPKGPSASEFRVIRMCNSIPWQPRDITSAIASLSRILCKAQRLL